MSNLEASIIAFAFFALFVSPNYIRQFAERVREEHSWALHRSSDGCLAAIFAFTYGLMMPVVFLTMILDDLTDPAQNRPEPGWVVFAVLIASLAFLLVGGIRLGRFVRALIRFRR